MRILIVSLDEGLCDNSSQTFVTCAYVLNIRLGEDEKNILVQEWGWNLKTSDR